MALSLVHIEPEAFEEWRPIPGLDDYEASSLGRIRRATEGRGTWPGRIVRTNINRHLRTPYRQCVLIDPNGRRTNRYVHRMVAAAFHGVEPEDKPETRHLDGDSLNNCASNLAWGTRADNFADQAQHGTHHYGRRTHCDAGHAYTELNTRVDERGWRHCRRCSSPTGRAARRASREAVAA